MGIRITPNHHPLFTSLVLQFSQKKLFESSLPLELSEDRGKENNARGSISPTISNSKAPNRDSLPPETFILLRFPNSTMWSSHPRWEHTHIVETFVKDKVPLPNGLQPLDNVGAPKSRMPAVKTKTLNYLEVVCTFSFISTSEHVISAKCYLVTTVLEAGPGSQYSIVREWEHGQRSFPPLTCCHAEGLESSFLPSLAGATPLVLPHPCSAPELSVPVLLLPAVQVSRFETRREEPE